MTERRKRMSRREKGVRRVLSLLVALAVFCAGFLWTEQNVIQTTVEEIVCPGLPEEFDGLRIVQLSDIHGKEFGEDNAKLLAEVAALAPDLIAVTGDLTESPEQMAMVPALAAGLAAIAPTYYVTGNHEWAQGADTVQELRRILTENGVETLDNEVIPLTRGEASLALVGADDPNGYADQKPVAQLVQEGRELCGADAFVLLLAHRNTKYEDYAAAGADLSLTGHAHGGLIRLPGTDGLIGPFHEFFPHYTAGLYPLDYGQMYVSRGLGNVNWSKRLFNRPHLPLLILHS